MGVGDNLYGTPPPKSGLGSSPRASEFRILATESYKIYKIKNMLIQIHLWKTTTKLKQTPLQLCGTLNNKQLKTKQL